MALTLGCMVSSLGHNTTKHATSRRQSTNSPTHATDHRQKNEFVARKRSHPPASEEEVTYEDFLASPQPAPSPGPARKKKNKTRKSRPKTSDSSSPSSHSSVRKPKNTDRVRDNGHLLHIYMKVMIKAVKNHKGFKNLKITDKNEDLTRLKLPFWYYADNGGDWERVFFPAINDKLLEDDLPLCKNRCDGANTSSYICGRTSDPQKIFKATSDQLGHIFTQSDWSALKERCKGWNLLTTEKEDAHDS